MSTTSNNIAAPSIPEILTANTYYWSSFGDASSRRRAEEKRQSQVAEFFKAAGFQVERSGDNVIAEKDGVCAEFHYSESCKNVYKTFSVTSNGKRSNITAIRKILGI